MVAAQCWSGGARNVNEGIKTMDTLGKLIDEFLAAQAFAVVGASEDPNKYGHMCYASLINRGMNAYPVNPRAKMILDNPVYPNIAALPEKVQSLSIITPPQVTEKVIDEAIAAGIKNVWMQPGAESPSAIRKAQKAGMNVIAEGPCLLVELAKQPRKSRL